jgi:hypothetical protein
MATRTVATKGAGLLPLLCRRRGVQCLMLGGINGLTAIRSDFSYQTERRLPTAGRPLQRPEAAQ